MSEKGQIRIALVGNPNIGKTTLFNALCGLNQKTGNYPGVTVDKKKGYFSVKQQKIELVDLPGINSLYPKSKDEELVIDYILNNPKDHETDVFVVTASALNLKRSLYLFHQLKDLKIPIILAVNMMDAARKKGIVIHLDRLEKQLGVPVIGISAKKGDGLDDLKSQLVKPVANTQADYYYSDKINQDQLTEWTDKYQNTSLYETFIKLAKEEIQDVNLNQFNTTAKELKVNESILRYRVINGYLDQVQTVNINKATDFTSKLDKVLLHPIFGYVIFLGVMFAIFQLLFVAASYPMDWIDEQFSALAEHSVNWLPPGDFNDLLSSGIIPGIGGVVIFIPQIAILFFFFSLLEESGYMARIIFLMDKLMQKFGMNGKSVVPLMSSFACAIPGIMAARTIENKKERLITIMVSPLLTCSARLPVYVVLISLIVPDQFFGPFHLQGIAMFAMYLLGMLMAMLAAVVFKWVLKGDYKSTLLLEMPQYLVPNFKNIGIKVWESASSFVINAGKIILATSIILFVLGTHGGKKYKNAEDIIQTQYAHLSIDEQADKLEAFKLENSYLGMAGKAIEPSIKPLGYDWKIGIAIISSLAAREVFVGTMSTIYSIHSENSMTIKERLKSEVNPDTGASVFNIATTVSLLLFYAFALQCLSTVAVTYKETKSIKWTAIQFFYMGAIAYFAALIAYQILK